jgi:hypothetical protein
MDSALSSTPGAGDPMKKRGRNSGMPEECRSWGLREDLVDECNTAKIKAAG